MGTQFLMMLVAFAAFAQIGCSEDQKPKTPAQTQAMINACMWDSTGQCQQRAKAMLENPELAGQLQSASASALANGGTGAVQVITTPDGQKQVTPVLPQSIREQAMKVQAALTADKNNPRSLYYDPPQPSSADRVPSSAAAPETTATADSALVAPASSAASVGRGGDIMR